MKGRFPRLSVLLLAGALAAFFMSACGGTSEQKSNAHLEKGRQDLQNKDNQLALDELTTAIRESPANAEAYYLRGTAYYGRYEVAYNADDPQADGEDFWRALTDFTKAIELNHNYAEAYHYRGLTYHGLGLNQHSIADYTQAIALNQNLEYPYYGRALVYEEEGQEEAAIADYKRFLELSQDDYWRKEAQKRLDTLLQPPS
jgi:tetratricopeptide (TPR) repeat protein